MLSQYWSPIIVLLSMISVKFQSMFRFFRCFTFQSCFLSFLQFPLDLWFWSACLPFLHHLHGYPGMWVVSIATEGSQPHHSQPLKFSLYGAEMKVHSLDDSKTLTLLAHCILHFNGFSIMVCNFRCFVLWSVQTSRTYVIVSWKQVTFAS